MNAVESVSLPMPALRTLEREHRRAILRTLRDLNLSIVRGRPITLPNLLRLYQRRTAMPARPDSGISILRDLYRKHQPFRARPLMEKVPMTSA